MNIYPVLSNQEEVVGKQLVDIAFTIHKALGQDYWKVYTKSAFAMNCARETYHSPDKKWLK